MEESNPPKWMPTSAGKQIDKTLERQMGVQIVSVCSRYYHKFFQTVSQSNELLLDNTVTHFLLHQSSPEYPYFALRIK